MGELLKVEHLHKRVGAFELSDINLKLESGYIMGIVGMNGAGKTTLIQTLLNLRQKDSGSVYIGGYSLDTQEKKAKDMTAFVLDGSLFEPSMTVLQNARHYGMLYDHFREELFCRICERFSLPLHKKLRSLSAGFVTRFQLAFALSHQASLYLMDEPASGLDPLFRRQLLTIMQELVEDGTRSVLFSTHITEDLDQVGDYIVLLNHGKIYLDMDMESLRDRYRIYYGSREQIDDLQHPDILYREHRESRSMVFAQTTHGIERMAAELTEQTPVLEDILYYLEKGGYLDA